MPKLRAIACTAVAALSALGISVGAAVAETANTPPAHVVIGKDGKPAPRVCFLHKLL